METLPGRHAHASDADAVLQEHGAERAEPWFGTVAIAAGLAVTPLLIVSALWFDIRQPIQMVSHTLPPGIVDTAPVASIRPPKANLPAGEPLELARLRLKPI